MQARLKLLQLQDDVGKLASEAESPGNKLAITKFTVQVFDSPSLRDHSLHFAVSVGLNFS